MPDAAPSQSALEAERRALLGDSRSVEALTGPQLRRFVEVCAALRALLPPTAKTKPGRASRQRDVALEDL